MPKEKLDLPAQLDMGEFISKEAHDLKSPFNRILGFTKIILKGMDGPLTDMQKDDLTIVYQNSTHAMALMSNLVDMARLGRGEKAHNMVESDLARLAGGIIGNWKQNHPEKETNIELNLPAEILPITADEPLMKQCLNCWFSYLVEYSEAPVNIQVNISEEAGKYQVEMIGNGKKNIAAAACDMTMWAYIGRSVIQLHGGEHVRLVDVLGEDLLGAGQQDVVVVRQPGHDLDRGAALEHVDLEGAHRVVEHDAGAERRLHADEPGV